MIFLATYGFFFIKHHSETLSIYKIFSVMVHTLFDTSICVFCADFAGEYFSNALLQLLSEQRTLAQFHVLALMLKMVWLSASIVLFLVLPMPLCLPIMFLLTFGMRLFLLPLTRLTFNRYQLFKEGFLLSVFVATHLTIQVFVCFTISAMCCSHLMNHYVDCLVG
jgi:hypothetical protein